MNQIRRVRSSSVTPLTSAREWHKAFAHATTPIHNMGNDLGKRRRADWISQNGPCKKCGSSERLEVDHIDFRLKTIKASELWTRSRNIREAELANCQVLCHDCHKLKTSAEMSERRRGRKLVQEHAPPEMWEVVCVVCERQYQREARLERFHGKRRKHGPFCSTICRNTGLSRAHHLQRKSSEAHLTTDEEILRLGQAGVPVVSIRKQLRVSRERVNSVLVLNGVAIRARGQHDL